LILLQGFVVVFWCWILTWTIWYWTCSVISSKPPRKKLPSHSFLIIILHTLGAMFFEIWQTDWGSDVIVTSLKPKEGFHCCDGSHRMHVPCMFLSCMNAILIYLVWIFYFSSYSFPFCIFQHQAFRTSHPLYGTYNDVCNSGERWCPCWTGVVPASEP
jgi:hypothetical protein